MRTDRCPGVSEYGHGLTATKVHAGGCCQEWRERIIGYVDRLGYLYCVECAVGAIESGGTNPPQPVTRYGLASEDDGCDGCHRRLLSIPVAS